jgi:excisionase family DNA binding protein
MMTNTNNLEKLPTLMTVMETAAILRIQRAKVYLLIDSGALCGIKVGSVWRITSDSLQKLLGIELARDGEGEFVLVEDGSGDQSLNPRVVNPQRDMIETGVRA